jgi:branched-chain amino acid transport system permease protein
LTQTIVLGLISGGIYGLLALGIALIYKGTRVLNFAQAEIGTIALYVVYLATSKLHLPYPVAAAAAIAFAILVGLLFERLIVRRMGSESRLAVAIATVGLLTVLFSLEVLVFGPSPAPVPSPISGRGFEVAGVFVSPSQVLSLITIAVVGLGLTLFLRFTDFGLGVLAAAQDAGAVRLMGIRLSRISAFTWGTGAAISCVAALLISPTIGIGVAPGILSGLFVKALAAALLGGLDSLPGAFLGGLAIGVIEGLAFNVGINYPDFPGFQPMSIFLVVLVVLLLRPRGLLGKATA